MTVGPNGSGPASFRPPFTPGPVSPRRGTFTQPEGLEKMEICKVTGQLATENCRAAKAVVKEKLPADQIPEEICPPTWRRADRGGGGKGVLWQESPHPAGSDTDPNRSPGPETGGGSLTGVLPGESAPTGTGCPDEPRGLPPRHK